jgi:DNA-binding NtrC family response regulator
MLADHFLEIYAEKYKKANFSFSERAYEQMLNYNWRGNVRELQHVIERATLLSKDGRISELNVPKNLDGSISFASISRKENTEDNRLSNGERETASANNGSNILGQTNIPKEDLFKEIGKFIVEKLEEPEEGTEQDDVFNSIESGVVTAALKRTNGNKQAAANLLGLYRPRLYGMIKRHNIE